EPAQYRARAGRHLQRRSRRHPYPLRSAGHDLYALGAGPEPGALPAGPQQHSSGLSLGRPGRPLYQRQWVARHGRLEQRQLPQRHRHRRERFPLGGGRHRSQVLRAERGIRRRFDRGWKLYRIPLRRPDFELGTPNIRLIQHLRLTVVADPDQGGSDIVARFALGRMRFLGAPWVRRAESPIASIHGATGAPIGEVVASTISTENSELGYVSPPGVTGSTSSKGGAVDEFGRQINERSLRIVA